MSFRETLPFSALRKVGWNWGWIEAISFGRLLENDLSMFSSLQTWLPQDFNQKIESSISLTGWSIQSLSQHDLQNTRPFWSYTPITVATWLRGYVATRLRDYVVRVRVSYPYAPIPNSNFNSKWLRGYVATRLALTVTLTLSGYAAT